MDIPSPGDPHQLEPYPPPVEPDELDVEVPCAEEKGFEKNTYAASGSPDFIFEWDEVKRDTSSKIATPLNTKPIKTKEKKSEKDFIIRWDED